MEPIQTLYERDPAPLESLPSALARMYAGGLVIPPGEPGGRPYVVGNFVETLDGVISFAEAGRAGGGEVSGFNEADHAVMGLLRAEADAVIFGSGTLHQDSGHVRTADFVAPDLAPEFATLRRQLGRSAIHPLNVVVSASGKLDLTEPTFHYPDLRVLIATTATGAQRLAGEALPASVEVRAIGGAAAGEPEGVDPAGLLDLLGQEYGVRVALHEGGPRLLAAFLAARLLDEQFLTLAPQLAGRSAHQSRPSLVEGHAFTPQQAPWGSLLSLKRTGSHLLLRYGFGQVGARA